jgi:hypothetical protein
VPEPAYQIKFRLESNPPEVIFETMTVNQFAKESDLFSLESASYLKRLKKRYTTRTAQPN